MTLFEEVTETSRAASTWARLAGVMLCLLAAIALQTTIVETARAQEDVEEESIEVRPSVVAQFTTGVENREPVDQITFVGSNVKKVFFFSDLRGLTGRTVLHRWIYDGKTVAEVHFEVRGPRWRVWSSKELLADWIGDWTVEIVNVDANDPTQGEVIAAETFTYSPPDA